MLDTGIILPRLRLPLVTLMRPLREVAAAHRRMRVPRRRQLGMLRPFVGLHARQPAAGGGDPAVDAAAFDGTNDRLNFAGTMGASDSKTGIVSFWMEPDTGGTKDSIFETSHAGGWPPLIIQHRNSGADLFVACRYNGGTAMTFTTSGGLVNTAAWNHIAFAWDVASSLVHVMINGVQETSFSSGPGTSDNNLTWGSVTNYRIAGTGASAIDWGGGFAEWWVGPAQYLDITQTANIQKWRNASGKPASLGTTGSTPTGTAPRVFLHLDDGEAAANFATNRTGNGNFTIVGTLTTYASSPSD